jgi:hypothetical protein
MRAKRKRGSKIVRTARWWKRVYWNTLSFSKKFKTASRE